MHSNNNYRDKVRKNMIPDRFGQKESLMQKQIQFTNKRTDQKIIIESPKKPVGNFRKKFT